MTTFKTGTQAFSAGQVIFVPMIFVFTLIFAFASHAESLHGIFMVVKGDVQILKDGASEKAKVGSKILPGQTVATGIDSRAKIVMSDRNVINISPETKLIIEKYDNDAVKGEKNVEMKLLEGKVRNNVEQKYDGEKSKFIIKTPTAVAGVRGTQFMTSFSPQSGMTQIVTLKGVVTFTSLNSAGKPVGPSVIVKRGEAASASAGAPPEPPKVMPKEEIKKIDAETTASSGGKPTEPPHSAQKGSTTDGANNREPAANPERLGPTMVDAKDLDVGIAREVTTPPPSSTLMNSAPRIPATATNPITDSMVREVIRVNADKTKVIVRPQSP